VGDSVRAGAKEIGTAWFESGVTRVDPACGDMLASALKSPFGVAWAAKLADTTDVAAVGVLFGGTGGACPGLPVLGAAKTPAATTAVIIVLCGAIAIAGPSPRRPGTTPPCGLAGRILPPLATAVGNFTGSATAKFPSASFGDDSMRAARAGVPCRQPLPDTFGLTGVAQLRRR